MLKAAPIHHRRLLGSADHLEDLAEGVSPLADSFLYLLDNTFTVIDADDDGGDGINSLLTYTAAYTGLHVIGAAAYPSSGLTGTYSLNAFLQPLTDTVPEQLPTLVGRLSVQKAG